MPLARFEGIVRALKNPNYGTYAAGNSVSLIGTWIQRIAVGWLAWELTGSGAWLGAVAFADLFPAVFIGPFGGAVADRAKGFGMPGLQVDGNDVLAVHDTVQEAIARARRGEGPTLIEALTYRVAGHFVSDAIEDRPAEEVAAWRERDPITGFRGYLVAQGVSDEGMLDGIDTAAAEEVKTAMELASSDPDPGPEALGLDEVFA